MKSINSIIKTITPTSSAIPSADKVAKDPIPIDTRPITKEEFLQIMSRFRQDQEFTRLPMPTFAYEHFEEFKDTELAREEDNYQYTAKQLKETDDEKRKRNLQERMKKRLEEKNKTKTISNSK